MAQELEFVEVQRAGDGSRHVWRSPRGTLVVPCYGYSLGEVLFSLDYPQEGRAEDALKAELATYKRMNPCHAVGPVAKEG